jgi:hypothetical protein
LLQTHDVALFAIVPDCAEHPTLLSTNRHLTQGGLDLAEVKWEKSGEAWTVSGHSTHLVAGDPYEIVFARGPFEGAQGESDNGAMMLRQDGAVTRAAFTPEQSGEAKWSLVFSPAKGAAAALIPGIVDVPEEGKAAALMMSLGSEECHWKIASCDPAIRVRPREGTLGPWPASATVDISVRARDLPAGDTWKGAFTLTYGDAEQTVQVRTRAPVPDNLALNAKATASSMWDADFRASRANDDDLATRWNSAQGDTDGSWLALTWPKAVRFDRVVIDECLDYGHRVQTWRLKTGGAHPKVLAKGEQLDNNTVVDLPHPMKADSLRLVIEKASEVPTIRELAVYDRHARR